MFTEDQYELLDFGDGLKLERFGRVIIERPCPAAVGLRRTPPLELDPDAVVSFDKAASRWTGPVPSTDWSVRFRVEFSLRLKLSPFGHLGVFPEQADNWQWLIDSVRARVQHTGHPLKAINLFAYTGGSTLALAAAGAEVTHVDAAANICKRARENAELSGLGDRKIRWISEDVMTFLRRETKRGNRYDIVVADPPSFGRGPKKQQWKIQRDLPDLLDAARELTGSRPATMLLSCHTEGFEPAVIKRMLKNAFALHDGDIKPCYMALKTAGGRTLPSGHCVRFNRS